MPEKDNYLEMALPISIQEPSLEPLDFKIRKLCRQKVCDHLKPIAGRTYAFKESAEKNDVIIGHWAEDGSPYEIKVPEQLRSRFMFLLKMAQEFDAAVEHEIRLRTSV